jgi:hypothetical protein
MLLVVVGLLLLRECFEGFGNVLTIVALLLFWLPLAALIVAIQTLTRGPRRVA